MSNSITSTNSNALRITGMATGLDTDTLIKQMMAAENVKVDKLKQNQQYTVWRQEAFRDIIKDFRDLRTSYLLIDSPSDTNMIRSGTYSGGKITTSGSNADALTATALPGAATGVSTIKVSQIAKSAKLEGGNLNSLSILSGGSFEPADWSNKSITFKIDSMDFTVTLGNVSGEADLEEAMKNAIKVAKDGTGTTLDLSRMLSAKVDTSSHKITFNSLSNSVKIASSTVANVEDFSQPKIINPAVSNTLADLGISDTNFSIKLGNTQSANIELKSTDTLAEAINKIYSAKSGAVGDTTLYNEIKVSFSELTKSLTIETRNTGGSQSLQIVPSSGTDSGVTNMANLAKLGFITDMNSIDNTNVARGQDAKVKITPPGTTVETEVIKSSNNFTIDNVTYNLIKDPAGVEYTVNLTTQANAEDSVKKIKDFIDKYNSLVEKINDKLTEKKDYNYKPLTDDQKKGMEEDDIKAWEEKAKKGVLKNDGDLQQILFDMRNAFMSGVDSAGIKLSEIGIDTYGSLESISKPGQLKVDEAKLKKALEERGDQVMKLFTSSEPSDTLLSTITKPDKYTDAGKWKDQYKYDNTGIFKRIESIINNSAGKFDSTLLKKAGYEGTISEFTNTITKQIQEQDKAISDMNRKLYSKQERYYQMFARLETAMNQMNSQQSWLTQQLGQ